MLVVKIELWPGGCKEAASQLGLMRITNDGTGNATHGNYDVEVSHVGKLRKNRTGRVIRFRRLLSPYHLIAKCLAACNITAR